MLSLPQVQLLTSMVHRVDLVNKVPPTSTRALAALASTLHHASDRLDVQAQRDTGVVQLVHPHGRASIVPLWAGEGWPTDVERLRRSAAWASASTVGLPVVVARRFSDKVRRSLNQDGVAWADETGHARLELPGLVVVLGDRAPIDRDRRVTEVRWSPGSGLIGEAILEPLVGRQDGTTEPSGPYVMPKIAGIADATGLSGPFISRTLQAFDSQGWTSKAGPERGRTTTRTLLDPSSMVSSWAGWYSRSRPEPIGAHGLIRDAEDWLGIVAATWPLHSWAATGAVVLERRAPFLTATPVVDLYLADDVCIDPTQLTSYLTDVGLRRVDSGARVRIAPASRAALRLFSRGPNWRPERPEVGNIRLYGDLLASGGVRGDEAADHLRTVGIGF